MATFFTYRNHIVNMDEINNVTVDLDDETPGDEQIWVVTINFIHNQMESARILFQEEEEAIRFYTHLLMAISRLHRMIGLDEKEEE